MPTHFFRYVIDNQSISEPDGTLGAEANRPAAEELQGGILRF